jgi:ABC-type branched-subunit amino acid transport system ATPase component
MLRPVTDDAILVQGLQKRFGDVVALDGVDFAVPTGTVLGLLGPNGAGKTTAVRVLTTILAPDAGVASVLGIDVTRDPQGVRERIGLAGQYAAVDENLTGDENLRMVGKLSHMPSATSERARPSCSNASTLSTPRVVPCAPTREACAAGWISPPRSCTDRRCCSSTSRRPGSIRRVAPTSGV